MSTQSNPCPSDLARRASILYHNGFGFQGPDNGVNDCFVLAKYKNEDELSEEQMMQLRTASGAQSCYQDNCLGRNFIAIKWYDYKYRESVLTTMLRMGISFCVLNKLDVWFDSTTSLQSHTSPRKIPRERKEVY
jgi:cold shock CspA family protein